MHKVEIVMFIYGEIMPKGRTFLTSILLILMGLAGIYYFFENSFDEDAPLELFQAARYPESLKSLKMNKSAFTTADYYLQKSYILNQLGSRKEAEDYLVAIVSSSLDSPSSSLLMEAYFNLMLSAYQERDFAEMNRYLKNAQRFSKGKDEWILLFMGISFYQKGDFEKALEAFFPIAHLGYRSPWMEKRFSSTFTPCWQAKHLIHCQIELGNLTDARRNLAQMENLFFPDNVQLLHYLSALSYLVETKAKSHDLAIPLYRQAISYLKHMNHSELKEKLRQRLAGKLQKNIQSILGSDAKALQIGFEKMIDKEDRSDLSCLPFYIQNLEKWGNEDQIVDVKEQLIKIFDQGKWQNQEQVFEMLSLLLKDGILKKKMRLRFENLLEQALQKDQIDFLQTYWKGVLAFSNRNEIPYGNFSDKAIQKALQSIINDDVELSRTGQYLDFYLLVEDNADESFQFAAQLRIIAQQLWEIPQERSKAVNLLKASKKITPNFRQNDFHQELENFFAYRYSNALQQDRMPELFHLLSAAETFDIASVDIHNKQEIEKKIDEAEYLYRKGKLKEAETKADWILKIDPTNKKVRQLLGMIAYYYADYRKAEDLLKGTEPINNEMKEAYAVTAILNGEKKKGSKWLEEVKRQHPIKPFIYYRIVYGFLEDEKPLEALQWLENIPKSDPNRLPARIAAAYQMNSWQEVIEFFKLLPPPYSNLDGYYGLVIDSLTALGKVKKAEEYLNQLLKRPPEPETDSFPPYFQSFKKRRLDPLNRFFIAGTFYKNVKNQLNKALAYFDQIKDPSLLAKLEKAQIYYQLGKFIEAKKILLKIIREKGEQKGVRKEALPMLATSFVQLGYLIESIPFYQEYFRLNPNDSDLRFSYTEVLMNLKRYDLALEQIELLKKARSLKPSESVSWLEILFHLGEFSQVDRLANQWLSNQTVPLFYKLQIAALMALTNNSSLLEYILNGLPDPSQRSIKDNQQLIRVWSKLGKYGKALDLAQPLEKDLAKTPEGLMVLAKLYMKLSRGREALDYAEEALQLNPFDLEALDFVERYENKTGVIAHQTKLLKNRVDKNPDYPTLRIDYARSLIKLVMEEYLSGTIFSINDSLDLKQARLILEKLNESIIALPETHFLLGKIYLLLDLAQKAKEQLQIALKLDPSFIEALQHLALVYEEEKQIDKAISALKQAAKFAADDGDVWEQMGNLFVVNNDWKNAVNAYQSSIRFSPFDTDSYIRLAETYLTVKKPVDAKRTLEGLFAFAPENPKGLFLMLKALYDPVYIKQDRDPELLKRNRIEYYDRLRLIDPNQAKNALPKGVNLEPVQNP